MKPRPPGWSYVAWGTCDGCGDSDASLLAEDGVAMGPRCCSGCAWLEVQKRPPRMPAPLAGSLVYGAHPPGCLPDCERRGLYHAHVPILRIAREMTAEERERQVASLAYGNTAIDCQGVTRADVEDAARRSRRGQ